MAMPENDKPKKGDQNEIQVGKVEDFDQEELERLRALIYQLLSES